MPMANNGRAKLIEEIGELGQVLGKIEGMYGALDIPHWDGAGTLRGRLEEEIADVLAACEFVMRKSNLDRNAILDRKLNKLAIFTKFDLDPES
jgi:NTP pyrophosphatase (non-canonical NTP hydrolase)